MSDQDDPLIDSDNEASSNDRLSGEKNQSHGLPKVIRFTVIGSLIGGIGLAGIAAMIGPGLVGYALGIGAALGGIIGFAIGAPPGFMMFLAFFGFFVSEHVDRTTALIDAS